jgi:hypothetical protein
LSLTKNQTEWLMSLPRLPDSVVVAMSAFVLLSMYITSGFNRYIGLLLLGLVISGVYLRVTKRGRWRPRTK